MDSNLILAQALKILLLCGIAFLCGVLVKSRGVKVNYTRKINHFALFCVPQVIDDLLYVSRGVGTGIVNGLATVALFGVFWEPVRSRIGWAQTMFQSFDRPEDRPYTLRWLVTQFLAALVVIIPMLLFFRHGGFGPLALMVILIATVGDGLAEPVGIRYGRRTYLVRSWASDKVYTRSYAGSFCVFLVGVAGVLLFYDCFTTAQFWAAIIVVPLAMTLAEAFSPHTWDTPFLILSGGACVGAIKVLVP